MSMSELLRDIVCATFRPIAKQRYLTWLKRANQIAASGRFCEIIMKLANYQTSYLLPGIGMKKRSISAEMKSFFWDSNRSRVICQNDRIIGDS